MIKAKKILSSIVLAVMLAFNAAPAIALAQDSTDQTTETQQADTSTEPSQTEPATTEPTTTSTPTEPTTTQEPTTTTGPQEPTGPDGPTGVVPKYAYDSKIGKWVSTKQETFYWNGSRWTSPYYTYNTQNGWYYVNHSYVPPAAPTTSAAAAPSSTGGLTTDQATYDKTKAALAAMLGLSDPSISNTGAGSTNTGTLNN